MKYQVEYRNESGDWLVDNEFESLGEAMSYATSEALADPNFAHRVTMKETVITYPELEGFL
tara:strand:- start:17 stop:199 length:183 start_codon:yes stop_codon:yes gene_type:complete